MYECFVGLRSSIDPNKFYLEEAGENCNRYADPLKYGMEMHRVGELTLRKKFLNCFVF